MKKFIFMAILAISLNFFENVTFAEKIYVTEYGSHSIYIETDSLNK